MALLAFTSSRRLYWLFGALLGLTHASIVVADETMEDEDNPYDQRLWFAHGLCMALAWGVFVPLAIAASLAKHLVGDRWGLELHRWCNLLALVLTLTGFCVALVATNQAGDNNFDDAHCKVGLLIVLLVVAQVVSGVVRPSKVLVAKDDLVESDVEQDKTIAAEPEPCPSRRVWSTGHRFIGVALLVLAWINLNSGIGKLYADDYIGDQRQDQLRILLVVVVGLAAVSLGELAFLKVRASRRAT